MSIPSRVYLLEGFVVGYARNAMNIQDITHHPYKHIIEERVKILEFYNDYGEAATKRAFDVSRSTIYLWKQKLKRQRGRLSALSPLSTAPKTRRRRQTPLPVADFIVSQRQLHPRLGKDKLTSLLRPFCQDQGLACPSASSVGRIIADLKIQGRLPMAKRLRMQASTGRLHEYHYHAKLKKTRRGDFRPKTAGELVQIDCVIKFIHGLKRYVISAVDCHSQFAFSMAYSSLSSAKAKDFLLKLKLVAPFALQRVQTDNGSEFYKLFHEACGYLGLTHFWNYPRSPKMNAKIERYNRTVQEEFVDWQLDDLAHDIDSFNQHLMDWLIWYNTVRPHWTLKLKSPMQYLLEQLQLTVTESNMLWTNTTA